MVKGAHKKPSKRQPLRLKGTIAKKARAVAKDTRKRVQWVSKNGKICALPSKTPNIEDAEARIQQGLRAIEEARSGQSCKTVDHVIGHCDVILHVIDARAPLDFLDASVETKCNGANKQVLNVVTKIDLVPTDCLTHWVNQLGKPTFCIKNGGLEKRLSNSHKNYLNCPKGLLQSSSVCVGVDELINKLKTLRASSSVLKVGIVGKPNVGKSALINSLTFETNSATSGNTHGLTKHFKEVKLSKNIILMDSPGVIKNSCATGLGKLLTMEPKSVDETEVLAALDLMLDPQRAAIYGHYSGDFAAEASSMRILATVAEKRGKIMKGGAIDVASAARIIVEDIQRGRVLVYSLPISV